MVVIGPNIFFFSELKKGGLGGPYRLILKKRPYLGQCPNRGGGGGLTESQPP